jgi:hypothetical protein
MHVQIDDAPHARIGEDGFERPRQRTELEVVIERCDLIRRRLVGDELASSSLRTAPPPLAADRACARACSM